MDALYSKCMELFGDLKKNKKNIAVLVCLMVVLSRLVMFGLYLIWNSRHCDEVSFFEAFRHYDANWYYGIAEQGYRPQPLYSGSVEWAFFPLMPMILRIFYLLGFHNLDAIGFFLNTISFTVALYLAFLYILFTRKNLKIAILFCFFMSFGVYSFYFSSLYTEPLFLLFLVAALYCLEKKRYLAVGIIGMLLSATRNTGVMLIFAVITYYLFLQKQQLGKDFWKQIIPDFIRNRRLVLCIALIPLGLFLFMFYLKYLTGDPLAFMRVQIAWHRVVGNPFKNLYVALRSTEKHPALQAFWALGGYYMIWSLLKRKRYSEGVLAILFLTIPLCTGIESISRYMIGSFVFVLAYTEDLLSWNGKDKKIIGCVVPCIVELFLIMMWYSNVGLI
ncbi:MAG: hypothetical protein SO147_04895 [Clostridia bacterium]|nr:hypothetical protein [Clostridia bacterium]